MKLQSPVLYSSLILAIASLCGGFLLAGYWLIVPLCVLLVLLSIPAIKGSHFITASGFLSAFVILAAVGIRLGVSINLMIIACTTALVSWDLLLFRQSIAGKSAEISDPLLEKFHLRALALAASAAIVFAMGIQRINWQLPFAVTALLVLTVMVCLTFGVRTIVKKPG